MYSRWSKKLSSDSSECTTVSSYTNYRYLNTPERKMRMASLKSEVDNTRCELEDLKQKITKENGVDVYENA